MLSKLLWETGLLFSRSQSPHLNRGHAPRLGDDGVLIETKRPGAVEVHNTGCTGINGNECMERLCQKTKAGDRKYISLIKIRRRINESANDDTVVVLAAKIGVVDKLDGSQDQVGAPGQSHSEYGYGRADAGDVNRTTTSKTVKRGAGRRGLHGAIRKFEAPSRAETMNCASHGKLLNRSSSANPDVCVYGCAVNSINTAQHE